MTTLATASERISSFVAGFFEPARMGPFPERIVIRHLSVNDRQADVGAVPLQADGEAEAGVAEVAGRLADLIATDAEGLGGMQRYLLVALRGGEVLGRLPLRAAGGADEGGADPIDSEPATARGLVAQLMRHNEANSRIVSLSMGQIVATLLRQNERLRLVAEEAEDKRYAVANLTEQLLSQQHERDLEAKLVEERGELLRHGLTQLRGVVPFVAACFRNSSSEFLRNLSSAFPVQGGPQPEGDEELGGTPASDQDALAMGDQPQASATASGPPQDGVGALLASLTPDQQGAIIKLLTVEQQMALFRLAAVPAQASDHAAADDPVAPGAEPPARRSGRARQSAPTARTKRTDEETPK
jgi:hypothetical protein